MKTRYLRTIIAFVAISLSCWVTAAPQTYKNLSSGQVKDIKNLIHNYLVAHPEVLVEASKALQQKQLAKEKKQAYDGITQNVNALFNNPENPVIGNPKAKIAIIEFFDYQCSHCKSMAIVVKKVLKNNPNVRLIAKELPIFGGASSYAAKAALAATKQGSQKYEKFHNALIASSGPLSQSKILKIAKQSGLNVTQLKQAMNDPDIAAQIKQNFKLAKQLNIMGTPAFVIGNPKKSAFKFVGGAVSQQVLQQKIDSVK